jgi:hypothetical protein
MARDVTLVVPIAASFLAKATLRFTFHVLRFTFYTGACTLRYCSSTAAAGPRMS